MIVWFYQHDCCVHDYLIYNYKKIHYFRGRLVIMKRWYPFMGWSKVITHFHVTPTLVDSHVQFRKMIVKDDVSVYQIFQRFWLGKPEFPSRWTAKPYSHLSRLFFSSPLTLFSFFLTRFLLLSLDSSSFFVRLTFARASFFFPSPLLRKLDSCFQFCAQNRGKEARCSIPLFLLLCLQPRRNFRIRSCLNFFSYAASILLLAADRRETCSVSVFIAPRLIVNAMVE